MIDTRSLLKLISIVLIKFAVLTDSAYARWATYDDADLKTEFYNENLIINKDGTTEAVIEIQEQILKESARSYATNYKFIYDGVSSDITLIEAKTINNGQEFPVTKDRIEDKTLASIGHGFDEQRQLLISYPNIGIGSKIYLKYKYTVKKPALSGVFSKLLYFGMGSYCQSAKITVSSELPLHIMVNDSDSSLNIVKNKEDNFQKLDITLKKPIYEVIPAIDFKHSVIEENETLSVKNNYSAVNYKGNIALKGEMANYVTGLDLYYSKQQMEDFAFRMISGIELEKDERKNLVLPQLSSRIVKDVKVEYEYERKNALFKTNVSYALTMGSAPEVSSIINSPPDRVTDLLMGAPHINTKKTLIKNAKAKGINKLNYSIDSPWIKVTRTLVNKGRDVEINDETLVLRSFITKEDLETLLFKNLKTSLAKDLQKASIVFE